MLAPKGQSRDHPLTYLHLLRRPIVVPAALVVRLVNLPVRPSASCDTLYTRRPIVLYAMESEQGASFPLAVVLSPSSSHFLAYEVNALSRQVATMEVYIESIGQRIDTTSDRDLRAEMSAHREACEYLPLFRLSRLPCAYRSLQLSDRARLAAVQGELADEREILEIRSSATVACNTITLPSIHPYIPLRDRETSTSESVQDLGLVPRGCSSVIGMACQTESDRRCTGNGANGLLTACRRCALNIWDCRWRPQANGQLSEACEHCARAHVGCDWPGQALSGRGIRGESLSIRDTALLPANDDSVLYRARNAAPSSTSGYWHGRSSSPCSSALRRRQRRRGCPLLLYRLSRLDT